MGVKIQDYLAEKEKRKNLELERLQLIENRAHELKLKKLELEEKYIANGDLTSDTLDRLSMEQMEKTWKDEFLLFVLFTPVIFSFIPSVQNFISEGFLILKNNVPTWYSALLICIVTVIYGMRSILKLIVTRNSKVQKILVNNASAVKNNGSCESTLTDQTPVAPTIAEVETSK